MDSNIDKTGTGLNKPTNKDVLVLLNEKGANVAARYLIDIFKSKVSVLNVKRSFERLKSKHKLHNKSRNEERIKGISGNELMTNGLINYFLCRWIQ